MAKTKYPNVKIGSSDFFLDEIDSSIDIQIKLPPNKPAESTKQQKKREKGGSIRAVFFFLCMNKRPLTGNTAHKGIPYPGLGKETFDDDKRASLCGRRAVPRAAFGDAV